MVDALGPGRGGNGEGFWSRGATRQRLYRRLAQAGVEVVVEPGYGDGPAAARGAAPPPP